MLRQAAEVGALPTSLPVKEAKLGGVCLRLQRAARHLCKLGGGVLHAQQLQRAGQGLGKVRGFVGVSGQDTQRSCDSLPELLALPQAT